jgi:maltooligosyltrehalose trehalohydrolase
MVGTTQAHEFSVWAPCAGRVDLVLDDRRMPMSEGPDGRWEVRITGAAAGTRYAFALDGRPPRPDPRSAHQPEGVDGRSELVDHAGFPWTDQHWRGITLPGAVLYELHVGTYSAAGTFDGAIDHLDHLVDLGVDAVELMPVAEYSGEWGWGYDGVDLFAPHHAYGGPVGLKRLIDACHARGLGVVLDVVHNHLGPAGNYLAEFGPYFSERHHTNWGAAVNLDGPHSGAVRRFLIDNALMWLRDYHVDGLRLDAVHALVDDSAVHYLEELGGEVEALAAAVRRPLFLIAESDLNDPLFVRSRDAGGYGMDAAWADEWHHALHATLTGERDGYYVDFGSLDLLAKALRQAWVYDGTWSEYRRRVHGRPPTGLTGSQFVVSTQNHDQVGNRAAGERAGALMSEGRLRIAAALLLTAPFTPMLFQGEEWGAATPFQYFTDHADPDLAQAVSQGRRNEFAAFGWDPAEVPDPQDKATFARSRLDWTELDREPHAGLLSWYRSLIALRRSTPELADPRPSSVAVDHDEAGGWLQVRRGPVNVVANIGTRTATVEVGSGEVGSGATALLAASDPGVRLEGSRVVVPPDSVAITGPGRGAAP